MQSRTLTNLPHIRISASAHTDSRASCGRRNNTPIADSGEPRRSSIVDIARDHIDDAVLALLFLGRHDGMCTWKSLHWAEMKRLSTKGLISTPVGTTQSFVLLDA